MKKIRLGKYTCKTCGHAWKSQYASSSKYQICIICDSNCYPVIFFTMKCKANDNTKPHLKSLCQNCIEGHYCKSQAKSEKHFEKSTSRYVVVPTCTTLEDVNMRNTYENLWLYNNPFG